MNLERIKKEIEHQSKNKSGNMYIEYKDLVELIKGAKQEVRGKERVYLNIEAVNQLIDAYELNKTPAEKEKDEFFKRIRVDMPDYKLTKIDENGYKFQPIKEER